MSLSIVDSGTKSSGVIWETGCWIRKLERPRKPIHGKLQKTNSQRKKKRSMSPLNVLLSDNSQHYDLWIICLRFVLSYLIVPGETCVFFLNCYSSSSKLQFFKIHIIIISGVTIYIYKVCHERKIMFVIIYSILLCRHIEIYD